MEEIICSVNIPILSGEQADIVKHQLSCLCLKKIYLQCFKSSDFQTVSYRAQSSITIDHFKNSTRHHGENHTE